MNILIYLKQFKLFLNFLFSFMLSCSLLLCLPTAHAGGANANYTSIPPTLAVTGQKPNVMVILDNSNSMDEAPDGRAVGSNNSGSKSEIARVAIKNIITNYTGKINMGLTAYQQSGLVSRKLHNSWYDLSYRSSDHDPDYDLSVSGARDSSTKKYSAVTTSSSSANRDVYYNVALPFYSNSNDGTAYCYSRTADFDNGSENSSSGPWDAYYCFREKSNSSNSIPASSSENGTAGYSSSFATYTLSPTDSDLAQNILDFGARLAWQYVGNAWFSNTSPGRGYVHTPVAELDATQAASLNAKLATSSNFTTATDTPLRNAGLTPLEGTLDTVLDYFNGSTLPSNEGGSTFSPSACSSDNYVILVTDGLPSTDASGNGYADTASGISAVASKAAELQAAGVQVYVVGFALPATVDPTILDTVASAGGTGTAYSASDSATLDATLNTIFAEVFNNTYSGSASAVVSNEGNGTGSVYRALYNPTLTNGTDAINWTGQMYSLFIDDEGNLREDSNGDNALSSSYNTDYAVELIFGVPPSGGPSRLLVERYKEDVSGKLATTPFETVEFSELKSLWNAIDVLDDIDQATIANQRSYSAVVSSSSNAGRHILSRIDGTDINFVWNSSGSSTAPNVNPTNYRHLGVSSQGEAENIIKFIRGYEGISGYRSRTLDGDRYLLGDIINSNPVVVGTPNSGYDILYNDSSYASFRLKHFNRRQMVYVGGNDGMLHAFNGGFWNASNKSYTTTSPGGGTETAHPLGAELWSYIPEDLLPHLQWLTDPDYSHVYYVDGDPLVFDAKIFTPDTTTYINGWGTLLVVGMGLGGGAMTVDTDGDSTNDWTTKSSYIILDITDPESPPKFFAQITDANMGFSVSSPAVTKDISTGTTNANDWYLVFGSGPGPNDSPTNAQAAISGYSSTQDARIYKYNLSTKAMVSGFGGGKSTGATNSFVGDLKAADWNTDAEDDAVYFGTVGPIGTAASEGSLYRLKLSDNTVPRLYDVDRPIATSPLLATDKKGVNWVYAGTGRLFTATDNLNSDQQVFFGVKEPVVSNALSYADIASSSPSSLLNVTDVFVDTNENIHDLKSTATIPTAVNTYSKLETYIEENKAGWFINLDDPGSGPSSRNTLSARRIGTQLRYTEYTPSSNTCDPKGTSKISVRGLRSGVPEVFTTSDGTLTGSLGTITITVGAKDVEVVVAEIDAGDGEIEGDTNLGDDKFMVDSDDGTSTKFELNKAGLSSGRQSWREIIN